MGLVFSPENILEEYNNLSRFFKKNLRHGELVTFVCTNLDKVILALDEKTIDEAGLVKDNFEDYSKFLLQNDRPTDYEIFCINYSECKPASMIETAFYLASMCFIDPLKHLVAIEKGKGSLDFSDVVTQMVFMKNILKSKAKEERVLLTVKYLIEDCGFKSNEEYVKDFKAAGKANVSDYLAGVLQASVAKTPRP